MTKGQKKTKGIPELYNEVKKGVNFSLTPTAKIGLDSLAHDLNLSRSELVEQIGRGLIKLVSQGNLSEEFVIFPKKSILIKDRQKLPEEISSFIVTDCQTFAYVGSSNNLKKRFEDENFLQKLKEIHNSLTTFDDRTRIFWLKCLEEQAILRTENELLTWFRSSKYYQDIMQGNTKEYFSEKTANNKKDFEL